MILAGVDFYGNVMWDGVVIDNSTPIPAHRDLGYPSQSIVSIK
jgi:hypothetical protein